MLRTTEDLKNLINELSLDFIELEENDINDLKKVEEIESEVQALILGFAIEKGYVSENDINEINNKSKLLDLLTVNNPIICDITWFYISRFYPDFYESKEEFLEMCKVNLDL